MLEAHNTFFYFEASLNCPQLFFAFEHSTTECRWGDLFWIFYFLLTDWFQYRPQRRYHFEWDASSWTWQVCRGSYWNKWPGSEGVLSGKGVYGILVQTYFCFTTADTTWFQYGWYILPKVRFSCFNAPWGKSLFRIHQVSHPLPHSMLSVRSRNPCNYGSGFKGCESYGIWSRSFLAL